MNANLYLNLKLTYNFKKTATLKINTLNYCKYKIITKIFTVLIILKILENLSFKINLIYI